ncbi:hypothetical protein E3P78_02855 [Wallemia ichthyophaga]|nr:hypothetical protein E3P78_02855 [Wallemia ichthyophaga]
MLSTPHAQTTTTTSAMNELKFNKNLKELLVKLVNDETTNLNELLRKLKKHGRENDDDLKAFEVLLKADIGGDRQDSHLQSNDAIIHNYSCLLYTPSTQFMSYKPSNLNQFNDKEANELFEVFNDVLMLRGLIKVPDNSLRILNINTYNHLSDTIILNALKHASEGGLDSESKFTLTSHAVKHSNNVDIHLRHLQTLLTHPPTPITEFLYKTYSLLSKHLTTPKSGHYNTHILQFQQAMLDVWVHYKKPLSLIPVINDLLISAQAFSFLSQSNFRCLFYLNRDTPITADLAVRSFEIYHQLALKSRQTDAKKVNIQLRTLHNDETISEDTVMDLDGDEVYLETIHDAIPLLLARGELVLAKEVVSMMDGGVSERDAFYMRKVYMQAQLLAYEAEKDEDATTRERLFGEALEKTHGVLASTPSHAPALKLHAWLCGQVYNTSGSLGALRTLLTHDSYDWEAWYRLANTLSASDGEGALSVVRSAIDLSAGTDGANDPLAAPTVTSVTRSYSVMQLLMLESALTETVDGAESALERHVELFAFFAGQIWRSAAFARAVQGLQFEGAHREVLADDAHSYPLKASGSEGALSGLSGLSGQAQLRRDGSISRNSLGSTPSSHTHSSRRKSKLHLPHPHMHLGLSVGGALGRLRKPRGAQGVQNTQSTHNTHNTHSAEKALPRIRVSSVPDSATGTQHSSHTDVATDTRTNSNSNSNNNSNRNSNALGRPALELSEYASHERSLLVALWVMSAATYRRARDWENAAHALHMAEEAGEMGEMGEMCGVYIELAKQCIERKEYKLANASLIKAHEYAYACFLFELDDAVATHLHANMTREKRLDAVEGILEHLTSNSHHLHRYSAGAHYMLAMCYKSRNRRHHLKQRLEMALRVDRSVGVMDWSVWM